MLSVNEANRYFESDSKRECHPTDYAKSKGVTALRRFYFCCDWWLRTPGAYPNTASLVFNEGELYPGNAPVAHVANDNIGVRPAIWVFFDPVDNNTQVEPDIWYIGDDEIKDPYSNDFITTTIWPGSRPTDLVTLAQNRLEVYENGNNNRIKWNNGVVRDAYWNEYQGYISFWMAEKNKPCPYIILDPIGDSMMLDAWIFLAGTGFGDIEGGVTDPEDALGLRFYGDGKQIYDSGLIHSIDGAHELHLDLSGIKALQIELYAEDIDWSDSRIYLTGSVRDISIQSALSPPTSPVRPETGDLRELDKRNVATNWRVPDGNVSDFTDKAISDPLGNTYPGCLYFGMSKHNKSAPWYLLDLGGVYRNLDFKCFVCGPYAIQMGSNDKYGLRFYADSCQIYDTGFISGNMSARSFHVDVSGAKTLKIEPYVADSTDHDCRIYLVDGIISK